MSSARQHCKNCGGYEDDYEDTGALWALADGTHVCGSCASDSVDENEYSAENSINAVVEVWGGKSEDFMASRARVDEAWVITREIGTMERRSLPTPSEQRS
jgi:hypothetical protein